MVGTPASQPGVGQVCKVSGSAPPSPSASSPTVEGQWTPSLSGPAPKRVHHVPTTSTSGALREEVPSQEMPLPTDPSEAITGPLATSQLPSTLQGSPPVPCHIP